jgi:hypothetical protein
MKRVVIILLAIASTALADARHAQYFHRKDNRWTKVVGTDDAFRRAKLATLHFGPRGIYTEQGFKQMFPHAKVAEELTVKQARTKYAKH